ncbi:Endonuclease/exonuclease/phosphatase [Chloroherpeton thalassium ATCC 35110]|uniref:Endonuclease/exonuclease/phosphatase n=1 Tax=Chloroherpeton thalassium (strain ATCC 35110 / GB-78) TaxID=517418 RepID=B3QZ78_CHLT3|nr:endonuclease/exonuclease/phosphatase family protein [Chloroherpeton thalassium]ACF13771.1 Endonuclease/exonuclease/phosphatase [Chloroherpeton thalassium ATCC 35110]
MSIKPFFLLLLGWIFFCQSPLFSQNKPDSLLLAWWNVENLFDTTDDPQTKDEEFTPNGKKQWTEVRLAQKMKNLAQVILDMKTAPIASGKMPDIIGFCEVEHQALLDTLFCDYIKSRNYAFIYKETEDFRGIDIGFAYDKNRLQVKSFKAHPVVINEEHSRDILEVEFEVQGKTLVVFGNHWPSRSGGKKRSEPKRAKAAAILRAAIDARLAKNPSADIVLLGDFNDEPKSPSIKKSLKANGSFEEVKQASDGRLYDCWKGSDAPGSYIYKNEWNKLDHAIVSKGLLDEQDFYITKSSFVCFRPGYLVKSSKGNAYIARTYKGKNYDPDGYSDHLPLLLLLYVK